MVEVCCKMGIRDQTFYLLEEEAPGDWGWPRCVGSGSRRKTASSGSSGRSQPDKAYAPGLGAKKALQPANLRPRAEYLHVACALSQHRDCQW